MSPDYTRPYKGYRAIGSRYDEGSGNYNSLQTSLRYRQGDSYFSLAYTYSKALATVGGRSAGTTTSQGASHQNPRNFHTEYGPPNYDFTNEITGTWVYNIPFSSHAARFVKMALGDWSIAGLAIHQSGFAMSPSMATSTAGEATRPDLVGPYQRIGRLDEWFNTGQFTAPAAGFFGDAGNGIIRGPRYTSVNIGLYKAFPLYDELHLQFEAEAYNLANHPNFSAVSTGFGSGNFGQVTSARDPRILEFALKLVF